MKVSCRDVHSDAVPAGATPAFALLDAPEGAVSCGALEGAIHAVGERQERSHEIQASSQDGCGRRAFAPVQRGWVGGLIPTTLNDWSTLDR